MRICHKDIYLVKPGELPQDKREEKTKKRTTYKNMSAAQRRKVDQLRQRVADCNRQMQTAPKGVEIR